jgi:hypothetical protein
MYRALVLVISIREYRVHLTYRWDLRTERDSGGLYCKVVRGILVQVDLEGIS